MARPTNKSKLPKFITPGDWRLQVEDTIKAELHPGRGTDDPGGLAPLALKMVARPEMEEIVKWLVLANGGKQFERYDTYDGNAVDLVDLIQWCVIFGKQPRHTDHEIQRIESDYETATTDEREMLFRELVLIARELLQPPDPRMKIQKNHLMLHLDTRLRDRFGDGKDYSEIISRLLRITPWMQEPDYNKVFVGDEPISASSVKTELKRLKSAGKRTKGVYEKAIMRRMLKVQRGTGTSTGRTLRGT